MNEKATEALKQWRESGAVVERLDPIEKAKRNPKSKALAIRAMCYDCAGGSKTEVTLCQVIKCPLYTHRPWQKKDTLEDEE